MYKLAVAGHPQQTRTVVVKEKETERGKYISQSVSRSGLRLSHCQKRETGRENENDASMCTAQELESD